MAYKHTDYTRQIVVDKQMNIPLALRFIAEDIKRRAEPKTPRLTGDLRHSNIVRVMGNRATVSWLMHYAAYQERGYTSGPVRRYTTPGTGAHFAETAVRQAVNDAPRHFKRAGVM